MTDMEFVKLVAECRRLQKNYFRTRSTGALDESKRLEKQVDAAVRECLSQPTLFPDEWGRP